MDDIRMASPCSAGWDTMEGDDRARFCGTCAKHVYNVLGLHRDEVDALLERTEGRACVRGRRRRRDGTLLLGDCPVGLRGVRDRGRKVAAVLALGLAGIGIVSAPQRIGQVGEFVVALATFARHPLAVFETADGEIDHVDPNL